MRRMGIQGQDWASYQPPQPDIAGIDFAFIKVTEGLAYTNPHWPDQFHHARNNGLVVGLYHYPHMNHGASTELAHFLAEVGRVVNPSTPGLIYALDWEGYDSENRAVPHPEQVQYKDAWLAAAKATLPHNRVGLYANTDYWVNVDNSGHRGDFLWIATAGAPMGQPGIKADWLFHQYAVKGVDKDYCALPSRAALDAWATETPAPPATSGPSAHPSHPFPAGIHPGGTTPSARPLQQALKLTGWMDKGVTESDHYGPITQHAVAAFNRQHHLNDVGQLYDPAIGPHGWALLMSLAYGGN